jgi:hypothetical protein
VRTWRGLWLPRRARTDVVRSRTGRRPHVTSNGRGFHRTGDFGRKLVGCGEAGARLPGKSKLLRRTRVHSGQDCAAEVRILHLFPDFLYGMAASVRRVGGARTRLGATWRRREPPLSRLEAANKNTNQLIRASKQRKEHRYVQRSIVSTVAARRHCSLSPRARGLITNPTNSKAPGSLRRLLAVPCKPAMSCPRPSLRGGAP